MLFEGSRDVLAFKSTGCSSREAEFNSQLHMVAHNSLELQF